MIQRATDELAELYELDETAWLETMSERIRQGRFSELDYDNLAEYLSEMAISQRREVESRLQVLIAHLLKWRRQPRKRTRSWRGTIILQRDDLRRLIRRGVLRNHAEAVLEEVYPHAVKLAIGETGLRAAVFPRQCPYELDQLLDDDFWG